jgi:hypothetical protein
VSFVTVTLCVASERAFVVVVVVVVVVVYFVIDSVRKLSDMPSYGDGVNILDEKGNDGIFLFTTASRPAMGPTCLPIKLTTLLDLVPRSGMRKAIPPLLNTSSRLSAKVSKRYIFITCYLVKHRGKFTFNFI